MGLHGALARPFPWPQVILHLHQDDVENVNDEAGCHDLHVDRRLTSLRDPVGKPGDHKNVHHQGDYYQCDHFSLPVIKVGNVKILVDKITFFTSCPGDAAANLDQTFTPAFRTDSTGNGRREGRDKNPEKSTGQEDTRHDRRDPVPGPDGEGCPQ